MIELLQGLGYNDWVLDALLAFPLIGGLLVLTLPADQAKAVALIVALVEFAISIPLWFLYKPGGAEFQFATVKEWIPSVGGPFQIDTGTAAITSPQRFLFGM